MEAPRTSCYYLWYILLVIFPLIIVAMTDDELRNLKEEGQGNKDIVGSTKRNKTRNYNDLVVNNNKGKRNGGWGWGGGGGGGGSSGGGGMGGGGGWGWGGGGGGWWGWGCRRRNAHKKRVFMRKKMEEYIMGEFAQCTTSGRCRGMRLDCPLHCGGPCFYDCQHMCKAHCRPPR